MSLYGGADSAPSVCNLILVRLDTSKWFGSVGGTMGCGSGSAVGAVAGIVPALFTFGLSIPICAAFGASTGL